MSDARQPEAEAVNERLKKFAAEEATQPIATCGRQSARSAIGDRVGRLRREAFDLEKLLDSMPAKLSPEADQALWNLVISK